MKRISTRAISILLVVTLSFMGVPATAFTAFADTVTQAGEAAAQAITSQTGEDDSASTALLSSSETASLLSSSTDGSAEVSNADIYGYYTAYGDTYEYCYHDSYFAKSSSSYDDSLSTMSFNLAMAAFGSSTGTTDADYANADSNIKDLMSQLGFTDYECTEDYHKVPTSTSIGAAISHKEIVGESGETQTLIAVAIRGGNYQQEWAGNATIGKEGEAEGFGVARDTVVKLINDYLTTYKDKITSAPKFWIVGFSRGSAVANLTANYLNYCMECYQTGKAGSTQLAQSTIPLLQDKQATQDDLFCYGFEVPAGGSNQSAYLCDKTYTNIWNIVDPTDLVPLVAPKQWDFYRYGLDIDDTAGISEAELKTQLGAISQKALDKWNNLNLQKDGDFHLVKANITAAGLAIKNNAIGGLSYESMSKEYKATYLNDLIEYTANSISNRSNYVDKYQETISILAGLMFSGADVDKIMSVAMSGVKNTFGTWKDIKIAGYLIELPMTLYSSTALKLFLQIMIVPDALKGAVQALRDNAETRAMIGDAQLDTIENSIPALSSLAIDLVLEDSSFGLAGSISLIPTALYYKAELISAHEVNTVLAYLRANDTNYNAVSPDGSYCLTYASSADGGYFGGQVNVKNESGDVIATYAGGELETTDKSVKASKNSDGSVSIYVAKTDANKKITYEVTGNSSEATDVYLKYYDYKEPGKKPTASTHSWQNQGIPLNTTTTVTLTCDADDAVIGKEVYLNVMDVVYDTDADGDYALLPDDVVIDSTVSIGNEQGETVNEYTGFNTKKTIPINVAQLSTAPDGSEQYGCTRLISVVMNSGTYSPRWGFSAVVDEAGYPVKDSTGAYQIAKQYPGSTTRDAQPCVEWSDSFDLNSLGGNYYIVCLQANQQTSSLKVTPKLNNATQTVIDDISPVITAASSPNVSAIAVGDKVTVSMVATGTNRYNLYDWDVSGLNDYDITWNESTNEFTFMMSDHDVDLTAIYDLYEEDPILTVVGGWDNDYGFEPTKNFGWETSDGQYYTTEQELSAFVKKQYKAHASTATTLASDDDAASPHCYFLVASEYKEDWTAASGTFMLQFDHWEVTQADGVSEYHGVNFGREVTLDDNDKPVYGDICNLDGCKNRKICIDGNQLTQSVVVTPVYKPVLYNYKFVKSNGEVETGLAYAGDSIPGVDNSDVPEGYTFEYWEITTEYYTNAYDHNYLGFIYVSDNLIKKDIVRTSTSSFMMPTGNVVAVAHNKASNFMLSLVDPQVGGTNTIASVEIDGATVSAAELNEVPVGAKVKINFNSPEGCHYSSSSGLDSITPKLTYDADGSLTSMEFTMPYRNVTAVFNYVQDDYALTFENATAKDSSGDVASGSMVTYGSHIRLQAAAAPAGYEFASWDVQSDGTPGQMPYQDASGNHMLFLTMPCSDVTVTPVYKEVSYTPISQVALTLVDGSLTEGDTLPTTVTAVTGADGLDTSAFVVEWFDEDGNPVTTAKEYDSSVAAQDRKSSYTAKIKLVAKDGYKFDRSLSGTVDGYDATVSNYGEEITWVECTYAAKSKDVAKDQFTIFMKNMMYSLLAAQTSTAGEAVELYANDPIATETFAGYTISPNGAIEAPSSALTLNFAMPATNLQIVANYTINELDLTLPAPVVGQPLSMSLAPVDDSSNYFADENLVLYYVDEEGNPIEDPSSTIAEYGTTYGVMILADTENAPGYSFADDCTAKLNGNDAQIIASGTSRIVYYEFTTEAQTFTVTFDAQGHGTAPDAQTVETGATVTEPESLTADGYTFNGWYKDAECTEKWDFENDVVTADTTLYAKWSEVATPSGSSASGSSSNAATVAHTGDYLVWLAVGFLVVALVAAAGLAVFSTRRKRTK